MVFISSFSVIFVWLPKCVHSLPYHCLLPHLKRSNSPLKYCSCLDTFFPLTVCISAFQRQISREQVQYLLLFLSFFLLLGIIRSLLSPPYSHQPPSTIAPWCWFQCSLSVLTLLDFLMIFSTTECPVLSKTVFFLPPLTWFSFAASVLCFVPYAARPCSARVPQSVVPDCFLCSLHFSLVILAALMT